MKMSVEQFCPQHTFVETKSQEVVASILSGSNVEQVLFLTQHTTQVFMRSSLFACVSEQVTGIFLRAVCIVRNALRTTNTRAS